MADYTLASGVMIDVTPLSSFTISQIWQAVRDRYPDVQESDFDKPDPYSSYGGVIPGQYTDEYKLALRELNINRNRETRRIAYLLGINPSGGLSREDMIENHRSQIDRVSGLLGIDEDAWDVLVLHVLISKPDEEPLRDQILSLQPVKMEDVVRTIPFFRRPVQGQADAGLVGDTSPVPEGDPTA